jgi:hypothetical protein
MATPAPPPPDRPEEERDVQQTLDRASHAVDRSRNLRQLIVLRRLLRKLAAQRRSGGDDAPDVSH